jgi:hypothetical protein
LARVERGVRDNGSHIFFRAGDSDGLLSRHVDSLWSWLLTL